MEKLQELKERLTTLYELELLLDADNYRCKELKGSLELLNLAIKQLKF